MSNKIVCPETGDLVQGSSILVLAEYPGSVSSTY